MRITCPECATVLKPANPIAAGKKVKCPKCGTTFPVEAEGAAAAPAKARAAAPGAVKKKPSDAPKPDKKPAPGTGDDDEGGTYAFLGGPTEVREEDDDPPEIDYAPDTSIKDLRGPAQAAVIQPTNMMIGAGVVGFLGWLAMLIVFTIPVLLPVETEEGTKDLPKPILQIPQGLGVLGQEVFAQQDQQKPTGSTEKANVSFYQFLGYDFSIVGQYAWYMFLVTWVFVVFLGAGYTSIQTYGAVRAQNLESRGWGIASSIMGMIPISVIGIATFVGMIISFVLNMLLDDDDTVNWTIYGVATIIALLQIAAAVYTLITLVRPEVIDGFEYVPDIDDIKVEKKDKPRRKKRR
jgi:predicted Zn finger-like uncharacterized protein